MRIIGVFGLVVGVAVCCACGTVRVQDPVKEPSSSNPVAEAESAQLNRRTIVSQPWTTDFRNFTYPKDCLGESDEKEVSFTLRNGEFNGGTEKVSFGFNSVRFADVTNDGESEALVVLSVITGGSALPNCIYVFTHDESNKIKLIYDRYTGDRASDGLRRVAADNGDLIIEQYTDDDGAGAAHPNFFIRRRFTYANGTFLIKSEQRYPNPDQSALVIPS